MASRPKPAELRRSLALTPDPGVFTPRLVDGLPEPVQRFFTHAIAPGAPLPQAVRLQLRGSMRPRPGASRFELEAEETLAPAAGLVWEARTRIGPLPFRIVDSYFEAEGRVRGTVLGIPLLRAAGPEVSRSSRHRTAAESLWAIPALLPRPGISWEATGDDTIRFALTIDGEAVPVTIGIDVRGAVTTMQMERFGDEGREEWGPTPYGFTVLAERTFGGLTIPSQLEGGWWFGTDRYDADNASRFEVLGLEPVGA
jgi:hypothetical protein